MGSTSDLTMDMVYAMLCREMKWTWQELENQPHWFITHLLTLLGAEAKAQRQNK